jgi:hypothetical protein
MIDNAKSAAKKNMNSELSRADSAGFVPVLFAEIIMDGFGPTEIRGALRFRKSYSDTTIFRILYRDTYCVANVR